MIIRSHAGKKNHHGFTLIKVNDKIVSTVDGTVTGYEISVVFSRDELTATVKTKSTNHSTFTYHGKESEG